MTKPKLIIMSGLPSSGKSTISERIATELKVPIFSVDPIESAIIKSGITKSFETGLAAYIVAQDLAEEQLKLGLSVVIDAVNAEDEGKQVWRDLSVKIETPLVVIECLTSDKGVHRARIEARRRNLHGMPEITWDTVEERRKAYTDWDIDTLKLDTGNDADVNVQKAIDFIASQH